MRPKQYRAGGHKVRIRFAIGQCALGAILVAESARGVCAISLGDDPARLLREFQQQFPRADLLGANRAFERRVATVVGFIDNPARSLALPLDVQGTAFQQRVWQALRRIPSGTTVSYREIAQRLGQPQAARAVAQACASNRLAVAIPCHRVVRSDGSVSGYRWGIARKRRLLAREAAVTSAR
jgi:AraC family transcriptional regulator of adaptative response/methylated-DNA-[protein]-cysteine methyltransferase